MLFQLIDDPNFVQKFWKLETDLLLLQKNFDAFYGAHSDKIFQLGSFIFLANKY